MAGDDLAAELRLLRLAVEQLTDDVEVLLTRGKLTPDERQTLEHILPKVEAIVSTAVFLVTDLYEIPGLAAVLPVPKKLGRLLLRAAGVTVSGFRIARVGKDRCGSLWRIYRRE